MTAPRRTDRLLLPSLVFVCLVVAVVGSLGAPLIPEIAASRHVSLGDAQWSLTITLLVGAIVTPVLGRLGDGPHRRGVILSAVALVLLGCILAALPLGFAELLIGRGLQGIGFALTPLSIATVRDSLSGERSRSAIAALSITTVTGVGLGYPVTGLVAQAGGVHAAYWFGAGVSALALVIAFVVVPAAPSRAAARLDVGGALALSGALATLLVGISEGESWGWASARVLGLVVIAVVLFALWTWRELRAAHPLVDLRLVRKRTMLTADVSALLAGVGMYLLLSMVTRLVQTPSSTGYGLGASVVIAGLALVPFSAASFIATRVTPRLARATSPNAVLPLSSLVLLAGMLVFVFARGSMWEIIVIMGVCGLGVGGIFAIMPSFVIRAVPPTETGSAMSFNQLLRYVGYAIGSALSAVVLEAHTVTGQSYPSARGYTVAGLLACALWIAAGVVSAVLPSRHAAPAGAPDSPVEDIELIEESAVDAVPEDEVYPSGARS